MIEGCLSSPICTEVTDDISVIHGKKIQNMFSRTKGKAAFDAEGESVAAALSLLKMNGQQRRLRDPTQLGNERGHVLHDNPMRSHRSYLEGLFS